MAKSVLTIHKEIEKEKYKKTPLGELETKLGKIYKHLKDSGDKLPESVSKKIYDIRDKNEKDQMAYIERSHIEHRKAVDKMLLEAMTAEFAVLEDYFTKQRATPMTNVRLQRKKGK